MSGPIEGVDVSGWQPDVIDWRAARAFELGEPMPEAWRAYRQALRDLPDQPGFPLSVSWPDLPA